MCSKDLLHLQSLPKLKDLQLAHVDFAPNPVCKDDTYLYLVAFCLPSLTYLDGEDVTNPEIALVGLVDLCCVVCVCAVHFNVLSLIQKISSWAQARRDWAQVQLRAIQMQVGCGL